jgi:hypothetical protein
MEKLVNGWNLNLENLSEEERKIMNKSIGCPDENKGKNCMFKQQFGIDCQFAHSIKEQRIA